MVMPSRSLGAFNDTSGQEYGSCPFCTEVVVIYRTGRVENHNRLITEPLGLGGPCSGSGYRIKTTEGANA